MLKNSPQLKTVLMIAKTLATQRNATLDEQWSIQYSIQEMNTKFTILTYGNWKGHLSLTILNLL